jgi:hypothetical protein
MVEGILWHLPVPSRQIQQLAAARRSDPSPQAGTLSAAARPGSVRHTRTLTPLSARSFCRGADSYVSERQVLELDANGRLVSVLTETERAFRQ